MHLFARTLLFLSLAASSLLPASTGAPPTADDIAINLRDPTFCDGVLTTENGGVITAPGFRVQARCIESVRKEDTDNPSFSIYAEGDLMLEYGDYVFTGSVLQYDFQTRYGYILHGRSMMCPWYMGAQCIELLPGGDYRLYKGFFTTSPSWSPDWSIVVSRAHVSKKRVLKAYDVYLQLARFPVLWLPYMQTHLDWLLDSPVRYRWRWGGPQGPRIGASYKFFDNQWLSAFLRLDYRFSRGPGGAIETQYCSPDESEIFLTRNYVARDSAIDDPNERFRYRFQGYYDKSLWNDEVELKITYDKISDEDMPRDYNDDEMDLETAQKTQLSLRRQDCWSISNLLTRVRVNDFESIKESLPALDVSLRPFVLGPTGIISENRANFGYFDFRFSDQITDKNHDYNSTRAEFHHQLYRPISLGYATLTPNAGAVAVYFGNTPEHKPEWVALGLFGATFTTEMHRHYGPFKHVLESYARYQYYTTPNNAPDSHFIFDLQDGWYRLNMLRFGTKSLLYQKCCNGCVAHRLTLDLYAYSFFQTPQIGTTVPRVYLEGTWNATASFRHALLYVWNIQHNLLDEINYRAQWTVNENLAIDAEYRHRSPYSWRKVDDENFIMDSYRNETTLLNSPVSDRRTTALLHAYYRIQHDLALELEYHFGWDRKNNVLQPSYREYQIDLTKTIRSTWHVKLSYQQKENDHRVAIHFKLGNKRPDCPCEQPCCALLE